MTIASSPSGGGPRGQIGALWGVLRPWERAAKGSGSGDFGGFGADPGVEVLAAQPVAVAREREDLGVVDEPVDHRGAAMSSPKISHLLNGLLLVTIIGAHS